MLLCGVQGLRAATSLLYDWVYFCVNHYLYSALEDFLSCSALCVLLPVAYRGPGHGKDKKVEVKGELLTQELVFQ